MGFDQQGTLVICVSPGLHGRWDVSEKGQDVPLASFDEKEDAYAYATQLTKSRRDATVLVEDEEGFSPLLAEDHGSTRRPRN
ncbi:DUF2188 domain-containing protein [Noviherbaspirillum sp.]|uniref:DUF2188 domain-containing protein n=1 Tax=Noviherbaspirillum sp. TaxID=1926288 RepID=UPI002D69F447|nr:DUF2188 domain-containing protein [Noviherbaspirillum sp.]HZW19908.1 DUF2188 domain-containing protein [Noviherbaspirillum sp.]